MNLRDLKPKLLKKLAIECDNEFEMWLKQTHGGFQFNKPDEPVAPQDQWRTAFSKGISSFLRHVKTFEEPL